MVKKMRQIGNKTWMIWLIFFAHVKSQQVRYNFYIYKPICFILTPQPDNKLNRLWVKNEANRSTNMGNFASLLCTENNHDISTLQLLSLLAELYHFSTTTFWAQYQVVVLIWSKSVYKHRSCSVSSVDNFLINCS